MTRLAALATLLLVCACSAPPAPDGGTGDAGGSGGGTGGGSTGGGSGGGTGGGAGGGGADAGPGLPRWGNLQWPPFLTLDAGARATVYGQVWVEGRTEASGAAAGLEAELGVGPLDSDPSGAGWSWRAASFNTQAGNNDEFQAELAAPDAGAWDYAFRYRLPGAWGGTAGAWMVADRSDDGRAGTDDGYQREHAGKLVVPVAAPLRVATLNLHCLNDDPAARLEAAATRLAALGVDALGLQEACLDASPSAPVPDAALLLAQKLSQKTGRPYVARFEQTHLANGVTPEGLAIVTALPVAQTRVAALPTSDFPRKLLTQWLLAPSGVVAFSVTHFSFASGDTQMRLDQANAVLAFFAGLAPPAPLQVLVGDFNAVPTESAISGLTGAGFKDAWADRNPGSPGYTHSSASPTRRIDYVFTQGFSVDDATLEFDQPYAASAYVSDHRGVAARLSR